MFFEKDYILFGGRVLYHSLSPYSSLRPLSLKDVCTSPYGCKCGYLFFQQNVDRSKTL